MKFFQHSHALVESAAIGADTRIWAFVHVLPGARIGADCNICDQVWDGVRLEDDVMVGPNATFTNDMYPRSKQPFELKSTVVKAGASIGANATILCGITIGRGAMVGAGSVVTRDVPD